MAKPNICMRCGGSGRVYVSWEDGDGRKCPQCGGTGEEFVMADREEIDQVAYGEQVSELREKESLLMAETVESLENGVKTKP